MLFYFLYDFLYKNVKKHISSRVWSLQHPNTGPNIQHATMDNISTGLLPAVWAAAKAVELLALQVENIQASWLKLVNFLGEACSFCT